MAAADVIFVLGMLNIKYPDENYRVQFSVEICPLDLVGITFGRIVKYPFVEAINISDLHLNNVCPPCLVCCLQVNYRDFPTFKFGQLVGIEDGYLRNPLVAMKIQNGVQK